MRVESRRLQPDLAASTAEAGSCSRLARRLAAADSWGAVPRAVSAAAGTAAGDVTTTRPNHTPTFAIRPRGPLKSTIVGLLRSTFRGLFGLRDSLHAGRRLAIGIAAGVILFGVSCTQKPAPPPIHTVDSGPPETPAPFVDAYHAKKNAWDLYISPTFHPVHGHYDLVVHFHGLPSLEERATDESDLNAVVVAVNHGGFAGQYEDPYRDPAALDRILEFAANEVQKSGRAPNATQGRLALSGWSAGAGSIAAILGSSPERAKMIDAILLEDGIFTSYIDSKKKILNLHPLEKFQHYAEDAKVHKSSS